MTTSARPCPFRRASPFGSSLFPLPSSVSVRSPLRFRSLRLSAPVPGRFLFLPPSSASLSFRFGWLPDTQLPVLPFSPPPVPPPSGFPNAPGPFFNLPGFSPSLPPGFPCRTPGSAYSALLFVSFRSSLLRSHSRSTGAAFFFGILLPILPALSMRPFPLRFRFYPSSVPLPVRFLPSLPASLSVRSPLRSSAPVPPLLPPSSVRFRSLCCPSASLPSV